VAWYSDRENTGGIDRFLVDAGLSVDDILKEYPHLKREAVLMVLQVGRKAHETIRYEM